jgi:hypothetical protein
MLPGSFIVKHRVISVRSNVTDRLLARTCELVYQALKIILIPFVFGINDDPFRFIGQFPKSPKFRELAP